MKTTTWTGNAKQREQTRWNWLLCLLRIRRPRGDWNDPDNWSDGVPGDGDTAKFFAPQSIVTGLDQSAVNLNVLIIGAAWRGRIGEKVEPMRDEITGELCTCPPDGVTCWKPCKGECGCKVCWNAYGDFLSCE